MPKLALDNIKGKVFNLDLNIIEEGLKVSRKSKRKRIILPIHREQNSGVQRMLNFLQPGTYIRPHKHPLKHATESIIVIQGALRYFVFDGSGNITHEYRLSSEVTDCVMDIEPNVWHSFVVLQRDTIIFESKIGPYNILTDKEFARWSPEEGSAESHVFMEKLYNFGQ